MPERIKQIKSADMLPAMGKTAGFAENEIPIHIEAAKGILKAMHPEQYMPEKGDGDKMLVEYLLTLDARKALGYFYMCRSLISRDAFPYRSVEEFFRNMHSIPEEDVRKINSM